MKNKAAAALGGEEAEQINSGAAESTMSAAIKAFKSDVTHAGGGGGSHKGDGSEEEEGEIFKSAAGIHSGMTRSSHSHNQKKEAGPLAFRHQAA